MIWAFLICFIPLLVHLIDDRYGDRKKINDIISLTILSLALAFGIRGLFDIEIHQSLALMFGVHFGLFDYAIVYLLRRNGVISPHAKILSYYGQGKIDRILVKINPCVILSVRTIVFGLAIVYFFT